MQWIILFDNLVLSYTIYFILHDWPRLLNTKWIPAAISLFTSLIEIVLSQPKNRNYKANWLPKTALKKNRLSAGEHWSNSVPAIRYIPIAIGNSLRSVPYFPLLSDRRFRLFRGIHWAAAFHPIAIGFGFYCIMCGSHWCRFRFIWKEKLTWIRFILTVVL